MTLRPLAVLHRRGAGDHRAAAVRDRGADRRPADLPRLADRRRGAPLRLLRSLLPRGDRRRRQDDRRQPRRAAREHQRRVQELFDGILHDCAETLRKDPSDMEALVRGITVYMIVIEGTLALTGARFILRSPEGVGPPARLPRRLHPRQPRRVPSRRLRGQVPRRRDQGGRALQAGGPGDAAGDPPDRRARVLARRGSRIATTSRRPSTTRRRCSSTR